MVEFKFIGGQWRFPGKPRIMGILNVTPDSFSDGGDHSRPEHAVGHALDMAAEGADMIDVGGESTRPGAREIPVQEEIDRVCPVIEAIRSQSAIAISIDTRKAAVAAAAVQAGAGVVNDVSGLTFDPEMLHVLKKSGAGYIGMHMRGTPETMQTLTRYDDIMLELEQFFRTMMQRLAEHGIPEAMVALDPGIGFGKTADQNCRIIRELGRFESLGRPVLMGVSRKSFIGRVLGIEDPKGRQWGTAAAVALCQTNGARIHRVHDVAAMRQVVDMAAAINAVEDL